jgi:predicted TIM-barrel fold metal-dependent hydrolase
MVDQVKRRTVLAGIGAMAAVPAVARADQAAPMWPSPVMDMHFHMRPDPAANIAHLDGCGVTQANLLTQGPVAAQVRDLQAQYPKRFVWFASTDITKPDAEAILTQAVKDGAGGLGEIKFHVAADGPELRRMYALAAELDVPITVHFQEENPVPPEGTFSTGWKNFEAMLKAYPRTKFIGHANAFWANVSADYDGSQAYPPGPIKRGGITDKLLSDYPNLWGDLAANSANNALTRDPSFTPDFLNRHQDRLIFGSDCPCKDGKGGGMEKAKRLTGKCWAQETLKVLTSTASKPVFHKLVWANAHKLLRLFA